MSRENLKLSYRGPYRLLSLVHDGHASQLRKACHDDSQQLHAVKTLTEEFKRDRQQIAYLKLEQTVGAQMDHERIIKVGEYGDDRGIPYLAIEWFPEPNLKALIRQGGETLENRAPKIALQAADAVAHMNRRGWIHRDIKPENFMVADDGSLKLIDFALAKRTKGFLDKILPRKSTVQGSPSYMSPEQIRGLPLDDRADLYSLSCTLFELFAGAPPFTGASTNDLLTKHLKAARPSLESANDNVTPNFAQLIQKTMSADAAKRLGSTTEFFHELSQLRILRRAPKAPKKPAKAGQKAPFFRSISGTTSDRRAAEPTID